jgi:IPT/TIG domain/Abnormal spindle-like microcephaly-assoc'd, ASPM-SPD-2-Hydin
MGLPNAGVSVLVIDPANSLILYAGTGTGLFKSTDGGQHWAAMNIGLPVMQSVNALAIDPTNPATLYAGTAGGGVFDIEQEALPPSLSVTPDSLDFDKVTVGSTEDMNLTVQNTGGGTLTGTANADAPFKIAAGSPFSVAAGKSQAVTVRFRPATPGTFMSNATFTSNGGTTSPTLSGVGVQPSRLSVTPSPLDVGLVAVGSARDRNFTVKNIGGGTLTGSCTPSAPFSLPSGYAFTLAAGQTKVVRVRFSPTTTAVVTQHVPFTSNGGSASPVAQGEGTVKPHIESILPSSRPAGTGVLIRGYNFGATQGTSTVKFGSTVARATYWSTTKIKVVVPSVTPGPYNVTVTTTRGTSNAVAFTVP